MIVGLLTPIVFTDRILQSSFGAFCPYYAFYCGSLLLPPRTWVGIAVLTGTHTLTLVWGTFFLAVCVALLVACYWWEAQERLRRR